MRPTERNFSSLKIALDSTIRYNFLTFRYKKYDFRVNFLLILSIAELAMNNIFMNVRSFVHRNWYMNERTNKQNYNFPMNERTNNFFYMNERTNKRICSWTRQLFMNNAFVHEHVHLFVNKRICSWTNAFVRSFVHRKIRFLFVRSFIENWKSQISRERLIGSQK